MSEAERLFYEWFHENKPRSGVLLDELREAFLGGWDAKTHFNTGQGKGKNSEPEFVVP
jgi:hypothetical protein